MSILKRCNDRDIKVSLSNDELIVNFKDEGVSADPLLNELKERKDVLLKYFKEYKGDGGESTPFPGINRNDLGKFARFPLSYSQERLWFIDQIEGSVQYHIPATLQIKGEVSRPGLEYALREIVNRHEVLRTVIGQEDGQPYQQVMDVGEWRLEIIDEGVYTKDRGGLRSYVEQLIRLPFDLSKDFKLRGHLIRLGEGEYILVVTLHHIASDGWSTSILVKEFKELYASYTERRIAQLAPLPVQYADYAIWQRKYMGTVLQKGLEYWKNKLSGTGILEFPTDYVRPVIQSVRGGLYTFRIGRELSDRLTELSHKEGVTLFMTLLAAFNVLLHRYTGQEDICVGTPIANRMPHEVEGLIGFFVNTLVLRCYLSDDPVFTGLLQQVKEMTLAAYDHQETPFEKIVEVVVRERDTSRHPLFQVMFAFQNTPEVPEVKMGGIRLRLEGTTHRTSLFDLNFSVMESREGLGVAIEYCSDLFKEETVIRIGEHFTELLRAVSYTPGSRISGLKMLRDKEQKELLVGFNETRIDYPGPGRIMALFREQVLSVPQVPAVVFGQEELTYLELDKRSSQVGNYLRFKGVGEGSLVPVCLERGIDMIVGLLAVLKAGAAYVPLDPQYPPERLAYMIEDTAASVVLTSSACKDLLINREGVCVISIDEQWVEIAREPEEAIMLDAGEDHLTYVIYTSGSTGRPKGVVMQESALVNLLLWHERQIGGRENKRVLQFASINFDASFQEIFSALCFGGSIYLIDEQSRKDAGELMRAVTRHGIHHLFIPYVVLKNISEYARQAEYYPKSLEAVFTAGEQLRLTEDIGDLMKKTGGRLFNYYGPSETHVVSCYEVKESDYINRPLPPIGKPIANTQLYILGGSGEVAPLGVTGEIYIGGVQVARGYLNRPELTGGRFISDPYSREGGARLYRTGDLGRWLADGNVEFIGRRDDQVKIRGNRVELGEVESVSGGCPGVGQCVVLAREDMHGYKRLVGYAVALGRFDRDVIVSYLKEKLPEYMIPSIWVEVGSLPLTNNGKVDRKALPDPDVNALSERPYEEPRNKVERKLAEIWGKLLGVGRIGVRDNFFEMGGHSLLATRVVSAIGKELGAGLAIRDLFIHPTIAGLSVRLSDQNKGLLLPVIERQPRPERIPLSYSQERLWFIDQLGGSVEYHLPIVMRLGSGVERSALEYAIREVVNRHEVLRTVIEQEEGEAYQRVLDRDGWCLPVVEDMKDGDHEALRGYIEQLIRQPFDLSRDHKLRGHLIRSGEDHILVVTMHHIASDGWSDSILVKEFKELYASYMERRVAQLAPLPVQYADYAIWQRKYLQGEVLQAKLEYWKQKLEGIAALDFPTDYARPVRQSVRGAYHRFMIEKEVVDLLRTLSAQQEVTMFMMLLSAFKILLYRYSGQEDICVGSPIAGRQQQEIEGLIGFFVNTLVIRSDLSNNPSFLTILKQVRETTLEAYEHQEAPFEKVVEAVVKERDTSRHPLFQVMFVFQNTPDAPELKLGEMPSGQEGVRHSVAQFDLSFAAEERKEGIYIGIEYSTDLFRGETIERMAGHYKELLRSIARDSSQPIGSLPMLQESERHQLLEEFNATEVGYPRDKTIISLFEEQVSRTPESIAVVYGKDRLSYRELNERSNQLGHYLRKQGVKEEALVPICMDRGIEMIVGILGILKAGGAYVPIDPDYPLDRIRYMLDDTGGRIVVTTSGQAELFERRQDRQLVLLDKQSEQIGKMPGMAVENSIQAEQLAYVIYTSGSTGKPKGVMVEHRQVVRLFKTDCRLFDFNTTDVWTMFHSFCFDFSVWELFGALLFGGRLVLVSREVARDAVTFASLLFSEGVTVLNQTPQAFYVLCEQLLLTGKAFPLRYVIFGGEALDPVRLMRWKQSFDQCMLINMYGITETTVHVTHKVIGEKEILEGKSNIGRAIPTLSCYILDPDKQLVPIGVKGELYIGGAGLARGYWNRKDLTEEKFIPNPFRKGERLYKTGDSGRWLSDGNIEFLGRLDEQVKIRGYRIEPGEVESVLQQHESVSKCVVIARKDGSSQKRLVGYVMVKGTFDKAALQVYLKERLPEYMVPSLLVKIAQIPLTANGKVDRKALPDPEVSAHFQHRHEAPRTAIERLLADIWQEMLGISRVGIYDNFFELGGHSIIVIPILDRIRKAGYEMNVRDMFDYQTIESQAAFLSRTQSESNNIPQLPSKGHVLRLNKGDGNLPVFIIPGSDGICNGYDQLAKPMEKYFTAYGLQMAGWLDDEEPLTTIEEIASQNITWIRQVQPRGPYRLIGHSLGGLIAYEMVRQWEREHECVDFAVLLDVSTKSKAHKRVKDRGGRRSVDRILHFFESCRLLKKPYPTEIVKLRDRPDLHTEKEALFHISGILKDYFPREAESIRFAQRLAAIRISNGNMKYTVTGKIDTRLIVARAAKEDRMTKDDSLGWSSHAPNLNIVVSTGDHFSMIKDDNAKTLVKDLFEILNNICKNSIS